MADHIILTPEQQYKFDVITKVLQKQLKSGQAAKLLGISTRQVRRLKTAIKRDGQRAIVHRLKNKPSNRAFPSTLKQETLHVIKKHYSDFKPGLATEKLQEFHGFTITSQTVRVWMQEAGLWKTRKQKKTQYRSWRPRKEYFGELEQFDGSYHFWFENRFVDADGNPIEVCLLVSIDDATGKITKAQFTTNEGVVAVCTFWKKYVQEIGKPISIYLDKFSTYKINHKAAVDNSELMTQFERAMKDLAVQLITAHSPQAKGRVERLFETLQDRLVKEMRLAGISNPGEGNTFLEKTFIPKFNERFAVPPEKEGNVHRPLTKIDKQNLNRIFSIQSTRKVNNDFTIQFKNHWYQLAEIQPITVRARDTVLVEEWLDETVHFSLREKHLNFTVLPERPKRVKKQPAILTTHKLNWKPPANHPWRKPFKPQS